MPTKPFNRKVRLGNRFDGAALPDFSHPTEPGVRDDQRNKIKTWNHRHQLILYMVMAGKPVKEIAETLGYNSDRVSTIKNSPLFQAQLRQLTDELKHVRLGDFISRCSQEALPNLEFLVKMRDDPLYHDGDPAARIKAAAGVSREVDRAFPRTQHTVEDRNVRITLDLNALRQMAVALADDDGKTALAVDYIEVPDAASGGEAHPFSPTAVEDLLAELEAAAAAEAELDPDADAERSR